MLEFIFRKDQKYVSRTVLCAQNGGLKLKFGLAVEELHRSKKRQKILFLLAQNGTNKLFSKFFERFLLTTYQAILGLNKGSLTSLIKKSLFFVKNVNCRKNGFSLLPKYNVDYVSSCQASNAFFTEFSRLNYATIILHP